MARKKSEPLYQDDRIKIDYHPSSTEDHLLYIREKTGEEINCVIPRGVLDELAIIPVGGIERKIANFNSPLLYKLQQEGISVDRLHVAICQAYAEKERRISKFFYK